MNRRPDDFSSEAPTQPIVFNYARELAKWQAELAQSRPAHVASGTRDLTVSCQAATQRLEVVK